jgi:outer membrane biosynthesis protein TonB
VELRATIASAGLHLAVVALAFIGLPELLRPHHIEDQVVNVEVVSLQDASPKTTPEPPKEAPKPPPPPEPPKAAAPPPPPPPPPPPEPVKQPEPPAPPPPKPEPIKQPEPPKPKPPEPQQVQKPAPPTPKPKPAPPPDQLATLLKNLKKEKAQVEQQEKQQVAKAVPQPSPTPAPQVSTIDQRRDAATLATMVSQQITPCWNVPAGARDARDMRVGIRITLNPDGSLRGIPIIQDQGRMGSDEVFRAFGESAIRALQQCSPLRLPNDKYAMWQDMIVNFDPKQLVGP